MKRGKPLRSNPAKTRAWQARGARKWAENGRETPPAPRNARRRNDSSWRAEVMATRGGYCRVCLTTFALEADHIVERSQGGPSVVENGLVLCQHHHEMKTEARMLVEPEWLDPDQIRWLAEQGYVWWETDGTPSGRLRRGFARRVSPQRIDRPGADWAGASSTQPGEEEEKGGPA